MLKKNIEFKSFLNIKKNKTLEKWLQKKINYYTQQKLVKSFSNNYLRYLLNFLFFLDSFYHKNLQAFSFLDF